jgi:hypothetical protein
MELLVLVVPPLPEQVLFATSIKKELALEPVTFPVRSRLEQVKPESGKYNLSALIKPVLLIHPLRLSPTLGHSPLMLVMLPAWDVTVRDENQTPFWSRLC